MSKYVLKEKILSRKTTLKSQSKSHGWNVVLFQYQRKRDEKGLPGTQESALSRESLGPYVGGQKIKIKTIPG